MLPAYTKSKNITSKQSKINTKLSTYRPSDWQHIHYAVQAYQDDGGVVTPGWELIPRPYKVEAEGYFGAAYINKAQKHIIMAHRGTENLRGLLADLNMITSHLNGQEALAWDDFAKKIIERYGPDYTYSFSGHSLGGWLAQACLWKYQDEFVKGGLGFQDGFAVTIDEPGSKDLLEALQPRVESGYRIEVANLDITNYLSHPNIVNTIMEHVGTVYALSPDLKLSWVEWHTALHTKITHSSKMLLNEFSPESGLAKQCVRVLDWPRVRWGQGLPSSNIDASSASYVTNSLLTSKRVFKYLLHMTKACLKGDIQRGEYNGFYTYSSEQVQNHEQLDSASRFKLKHGVHYRIEEFDEQTLPLRNMPTCIRGFLEDLSVEKNRAKAVEYLIAKAIDKELARLLNAYSINERAEVVIDKAETGISARGFLIKIRGFLSEHAKLYQNKLSILEIEALSNQLQNLQADMLPNLMSELQSHMQNTKNLLYRLSLKQGTARLYKFIKPSIDELSQVKDEHEVLSNQIDLIEGSKLRLQNSSIASEAKKELQTKLEVQEQHLKIGKQMTFALLNYMEGNIEQANNELDTLISLLAVLTKTNNSNNSLEPNLLLNRAYNLKAKIAALGGSQESKELSSEYYDKAAKLLPTDAITRINFIGLLTDRARSEENIIFQLQAYSYYQEAHAYLRQVPPEQIPIAYSGLAYSLIMLAQYINQGKIKAEQLLKLPSINILHNQAQILLKQAIEVNPNYLNARLFLALLSYEQQNYPQALQEIENVLTLQIMHPTALMRKGFILEKLGEKEKSLEYLAFAKAQLTATQKNSENVNWIREIEEKVAQINEDKEKLGQTLKL